MTNLTALAVAVGVPLGAGQALGIWSAPDIKDWYPKLQKPSWTPPVLFFGPAWSVLYTLMGFAAYRVWQAGAPPLAMGLYTLQLVLNLAWQPLMFKAHDLRAASYDITALLVVLAATIVEFRKVDPAASTLLLPYFAFSAFAAALTYAFRQRNPPKVD